MSISDFLDRIATVWEASELVNCNSLLHITLIAMKLKPVFVSS